MRRFGRWGWLVVLAAILCCGIMAWLTADQVAGTVRTGAESALDGAGLGSDVAFAGIDGFDGIGRDGLNVTLEGPAAAESAAIEAVRARSEVDQVSYRVIGDDGEESDSGDVENATSAESESDPEPADQSEAEPGAASQPAPAADLDAAVVTATATGGAIDLVGSVPDESTRSALITAAVNEYGAANVTHDIAVDPESVTIDGGTLVLSGQAASEEERSGWAARVESLAGAGGLDLVDRSSVKTVEESLNELFTLEPIEFDVNRATIRSRSEPTLAAAAELINANPDVGRLRVVGHTDSDGSAGANQELSEARAQAVVDYLVETGGVDADRLEAEGRGESELLVDPEITQADKQRNRRIAWEPAT